MGDREMHKPYGPYEKYLKRPIDLLCGLAAVLVFCWLYILLIILGFIFMNHIEWRLKIHSRRFNLSHQNPPLYLTYLMKFLLVSKMLFQSSEKEFSGRLEM